MKSIRTLDGWLGLKTKTPERPPRAPEPESGPALAATPSLPPPPPRSKPLEEEEAKTMEIKVESPHEVEGSAAALETKETSSEAVVNDVLAARAERLRRNRLVLASLGLEASSSESSPSHTIKKPTGVRKRPVLTPVGEVRRSRRLGRHAAGATEEDPPSEERAPPPPAPEVASFVESSLYSRYVPEDASLDPSELDAAPRGATLRTRRVYEDDAMKQSYTLAFHPELPGLLASGGQNGRASVFHPDDGLVFSWKPAGGWCSSVKFLTRDRLLVASNNKSLTCWDLSQRRVSDDRTPRATLTETSLHSSGIFDMDVEYETKTVVTASKDGRLRLSRLQQDRREDAGEWASPHEARVVRSARFHPSAPALLASGGDDGFVRVFDVRSRSSEIKLRCESLSGVNVVRWDPASPHRLLGAGFECVVAVFDARRPDAACAELRGHFDTPATRGSKIYQPCYFRGGSYLLAAGGDGSRSLTCFRVDTGAVESKARTEWTPIAVAADAAGDQIAVSHGSLVTVFE